MSDESRIARLEKMVELLTEALFQDGKLPPMDISSLHTLLNELRASKRREEVREEVRKELGIGLGEHSDYDMR